MLRFPDDKVCYVFPLLNEQSTPEKLIRDLEKANQVRTKKYFHNILLYSYLRNSFLPTPDMKHKAYSVTLLGDLTECRINRQSKWGLTVR